MSKLIISPPPHLHGGNSVTKIMYRVLISLLPAYLVALYYFGLGAFIVSLVSVLSCVFFEHIIQVFIFHRPSSIKDGSAILTGILLSFNLPSNIPLYLVVLGAFIAIAIAKMSFGGLGNNPFNPALVARVFLLISFPVPMTTWPLPELANLNISTLFGGIAYTTDYLDAYTGATTLSVVKYKIGEIPYVKDLLLGNMGGSMGEVSALALFLGFIYLLYKKIITWHIPIAVLLTSALIASIFYWIDAEVYMSPLVHILSGGMLLGAIYMATDYASSPMSRKGMLIYGVGIGLITMVIRYWGAYPEGISFAILIMNAFTPIINKYSKPKRYGEVKL